MGCKTVRFPGSALVCCLFEAASYRLEALDNQKRQNRLSKTHGLDTPMRFGKPRQTTGHRVSAYPERPNDRAADDDSEKNAHRKNDNDHDRLLAGLG